MKKSEKIILTLTIVNTLAIILLIVAFLIEKHYTVKYKLQNTLTDSLQDAEIEKLKAK